MQYLELCTFISQLQLRMWLKLIEYRKLNGWKLEGSVWEKGGGNWIDYHSVSQITEPMSLEFLPSDESSAYAAATPTAVNHCLLDFAECKLSSCKCTEIPPCHQELG